MRKNFKPESMIFPLPVLVLGSYDKENKPNAMTAAWGGIYDTNQVFVCLASDHKSSQNIRERHEFSVSFATKDTTAISDYFGIKSGYKEDKISKAKATANKCQNIDAPYFEEFPVFLECRVFSFKEENETIYLVADIVNISADESVLNEKGRIDIKKLQPICYNPSEHTYNVVGEQVGLAFRDGNNIK